MKAAGYVLDTNICAFYLRGKFDVDQAIDRVGWENCYISEVTELELKFGVELLLQRDGVDKSAELNRFLNAIRILPIVDAVNLAAKDLNARKSSSTLGSPLAKSIFDMLRQTDIYCNA